MSTSKRIELLLGGVTHSVLSLAILLLSPSLSVGGSSERSRREGGKMKSKEHVMNHISSERTFIGGREKEERGNLDFIHIAPK